MIIKPYPLSSQVLPRDEAAQEKRTCKRFGPCGVGKKALLLNSFFIDRRYYVPFTAIQRVYKRVAMSKGGFTGKGMFASIPYLVVEYDNGKQKQCNFKHEEQVDQLLACLQMEQPQIKLHSAQAEARLAEAAQRRAAQLLPQLSPAAQESVDALQQAIDFLDKRPDLTTELSQAARQQRSQTISKPAWRWTALAILLLGAASAAFGVWQLVTRQGDFGVYFALFGFAAVFLFSGVSIAPTVRDNKKRVAQRYAGAKAAAAAYLEQYPGSFPVPAYYAHPIVLQRMQWAIRTGKAVTAAEALDTVKRELKALNSSVQVEQEEYDQVVAVKPMFLNEEYR